MTTTTLSVHLYVHRQPCAKHGSSQLTVCKLITPLPGEVAYPHSLARDINALVHALPALSSQAYSHDFLLVCARVDAGLCGAALLGAVIAGFCWKPVRHPNARHAPPTHSPRSTTTHWLGCTWRL